MSKMLPGLVNLFKSIGLKQNDRVLILIDRFSNKKAIQVLTEAFESRRVRLKIENLPLRLQNDFPPHIRKIVREFDVIILVANQSWYQAPTRRKAKRQYKKRVVECYNLKPEMMKNGALCADYEKVRLFTEGYKKNFRVGSSLIIRTEKGTNFSAVIRGVFVETGCYDKPGAGGNLPAGEISLGLVGSSFNGKIVFDLSFDILGRLERQHLTVSVKDGKVIKVKGKIKRRFEVLFRKDKRLRNIAEIGIGTNEYAIVGRSVLEDEKQFGTVHIGFGNNAYFGGRIDGPHLDGVFQKAKIIVDGKAVIVNS